MPTPTDPTARFSDRVRAYVRARPDYPPAVLDAIEEETGLRPPADVADVGSGTGIFTRLLLERGYSVHAVEPNGAMRGAAEEALSPHPRFRSLAGRAEATMLPDASVDLVTAAQAFHWFDPDAARQEWRRILRPPFRVAVLWNDRVSEGAGFAGAYEALVRRWGGEEYLRVRASWDVGGALERLFGAGGWRERRLSNRQCLGRAAFVERLVSSSYLPGPGHPRHGPMVRAARRLFRLHAVDGVVALDYVTRVYVGTLPAAATPGTVVAAREATRR